MTTITAAGSLMALLMGAQLASAATISGSYDAYVNHTCADTACTSYVDILTGTGFNTLQGASTISASVFEDNDADLGTLHPGPIVITALSDGSEISGILDVSWVPGIAIPAFETRGTAAFSGGTGAYAGFAAIEPVVMTGFFTGPTGAAGTLTLTPEPHTWAELLAALPVFYLIRRFRSSRS